MGRVGVTLEDCAQVFDIKITVPWTGSVWVACKKVGHKLRKKYPDIIHCIDQLNTDNHRKTNKIFLQFVGWRVVGKDCIVEYEGYSN